MNCNKEAEQATREPITRSKLRAFAGMKYYSMRRKFLWLEMNRYFANEKAANDLDFKCFSYRTPLLRQLKDVDMQLQYNKINNIKIAVECLDGILIKPGEVFSYWKLIGKPCRKKGYIEGMVLNGGKVCTGVGGGLCQLSNLIFWMALHTPLTVVERHRHGYDVFPDAHRTQPFGTGATCYYPHGDLMIQNNTQDTYQLRVRVGEEFLRGEFRCSRETEFQYEIIERNHFMRGEYWGGYSRHNEIFRKVFDKSGQLLAEEFLFKNAALMMYSPFIDSKHQL